MIAEKVDVERGGGGSVWCSHKLCWFMKRHPHLSLRSSDSTGYARINEENLKAYLGLLDTVLEENNLKAQIYNMDEMGLPLNP